LAVDLLTIVLRFVHILAAIAWAGGGLFVLAVLDPMMGRISAAEGNRFMRHIQLRTKLAAYFPVTAVLTVVAGIVLYFVVDGRTLYPMSTTQGQVFHVGMVFGVLALVWGGAMEGRLNGKLGKLARRVEGKAADPGLEAEMTLLGGKLRGATRVSGALLLVAIFGMSTFQYF
jgi:uncharacterized membrane protein